MVEKGVRAVFVKSGVDTADGRRWRGLLNMHAMMDEFVVEMTADHVRAAHEGLPVLVDLYRTPEVSTAEGARHRTPVRLMCRLLRLVLLRFPGRAFVFAGDSGFGTHEVARFCRRHGSRLTLVSKCHPDLNLFELPPPYAGNSRPWVKGGRFPKPRQVAATARRARLTVAWYGGGTQRVEAATGVGHWYQGRAGLVRWVFVKDATGTHRDEFLFTTDTGLTAGAVVGAYCGRRSIETTRGRCKATVLRAGPCLFGLYTAAAVLSHALPEAKRVGAVSWPGKVTVTFSDALCAVRRWLWAEAVLPQAGDSTALQKPPSPCGNCCSPRWRRQPEPLESAPAELRVCFETGLARFGQVG